MFFFDIVSNQFSKLSFNVRKLRKLFYEMKYFILDATLIRWIIELITGKFAKSKTLNFLYWYKNRMTFDWFFAVGMNNPNWTCVFFAHVSNNFLEKGVQTVYFIIDRLGNCLTMKFSKILLLKFVAFWNVFTKIAFNT